MIAAFDELGLGAPARISAAAVGTVVGVYTAVFAALRGQFTGFGYRNVDAAAGALPHLFRAIRPRRRFAFGLTLAFVDFANTASGEKKHPNDDTDQHKKQHFSHT
jgi:hypothetical protein